MRMIPAGNYPIFLGIRATKLVDQNPFLFFLFSFFSQISSLSHHLVLSILQISFMAAMNIEGDFGVTNIKSHIPLILDLDDHNYDAWHELFSTHCLTFDVAGHIDGTSVPDGDNDVQWNKRDGLVKLWIYGTLAPALFKSSFETGGTARDI